MPRLSAVLLLAICYVAVASAQASCPLPSVPPNFQTDFFHRVAASSGSGTLTGHIYNDQLNNRTRFDYSISGVNYTIYEFINVNQRTETQYIVSTYNGVQSCTKRTFPWAPEVENCTAWEYQGSKTINGKKVVAWLTNCTFSHESYAVEWFWLGPYPCQPSALYTPAEVIIQGPGYYSETDYNNFNVGTGGNDNNYVTPTNCSSAGKDPRGAPQTAAHSDLRRWLAYFQ